MTQYAIRAAQFATTDVCSPVWRHCRTRQTRPALLAGAALRGRPLLLLTRTVLQERGGHGVPPLQATRFICDGGDSEYNLRESPASDSHGALIMYKPNYCLECGSQLSPKRPFWTS